jgi:signal transduction histidine kinase/CheY-like chemotaxis protein
MGWMQAMAAWMKSLRGGARLRAGMPTVVYGEDGDAGPGAASREDAPHAALQRLMLALQGAGLGVWDCHLPSGQVQVSPQALAIAGLPSEGDPADDGLGWVLPLALVASLLRQQLHPDDGPVLQQVEQAWQQRLPFEATCRLQRPGGAPRWVQLQGCWTGPDEPGRPQHVVGTLADITPRRRAEAAWQQAHQRKDELLATLAHELRNPLAPIRQAAGIARSPLATPQQVRWSHEVIARQLQHMATLLDDLLDIARLARGKLALRLQRVELGDIVAAAVEGARPLIDARGHVLEIDAARQPVELEVDSVRLAQVLCNVLNNAAKYTDAGGCIRVSWRLEDDRAVLRVADTGIGLAPEALGRVFEMFAQVASPVDRSAGGLGIGLALSRALVELHGGRIRACSDGIGCGTTIVIELPRPAAAVAPTRAPVSPPQPPHDEGQPPRKVLVVDDDVDAAETLAVLLQLDGHEVRTAHAGRDALRLAAGFRPDIVFLDIGMADLDGLEVARHLRGQPWGSEATLVALTGRGRREDRESAWAAGFDHHFTKPLDESVVRRLVLLRPPRQ